RPARAVRAVRAERPTRAVRAGGGDVAVRERHEGLFGWIVRNVVSLPSTIGSLPTLVVAALRSFALEVAAVIGGIGRVLLSVLPGSNRVAGAGRTVVGRARTTRRSRSSETVAAPHHVDALEMDAPILGRRERVLRTPAQQRAAQERRARLKARVRLVLVVGLLVGVVAAWVVVPASDVFRIRHLEVTGASAVGDLEVRARIDSLLTGETVYTVDEDKVASRIEELPFVRSVRVERHLPGGLQLHVIEYRPLALGFGDGQFWLVARNGRVLAKASNKEWSGRIPTVTLRDGDIEAGDHVEDEPALRLLSSRPSSSTLEFATIKADEYAITAQLVDGTEVRFGRPTALRQKLLVAEKMLHEAARKDLEPLYVDVTVPGKPAFCAKSVVACGMRRGPATTDTRTKPGATAGSDAANDATPEETSAEPITNGADELAADDA
ncbi:MAG: hypothetical protein JWL76_357, partial [Thermoleophilia bacterium]|nr:hypothetical protein [Thermoleophilia bacterium]